MPILDNKRPRQIANSGCCMNSAPHFMIWQVICMSNFLLITLTCAASGARISKSLSLSIGRMQSKFKSVSPLRLGWPVVGMTLGSINGRDAPFHGSAIGFFVSLTLFVSERGNFLDVKKPIQRQAFHVKKQSRQFQYTCNNSQTLYGYSKVLVSSFASLACLRALL